jgi:hypothetical protein
VLESDDRELVSIASPPGGDGRGSIQQAVISPAKRTSITISSPNGEVWVSSKESVRNGVYTHLEATGNSLVPEGPYDGDDVRNAAIGEFLALSGMMLYTAVQARRGASEKGERLA